MKQYRSEMLLEKHCPTIYDLTKKSKNKIDWKEIDAKFEADYFKIGIETESNLIGLLLHAESGEKFPLSFFNYYEILTKSLINLTKEDRKFRDIIIGKITNFKDLNYLNPIGELSVLKKFTDNGYELIRIEDKQLFPKSKPKDFLFKSPNGGDILIEVINIHVRRDFNTLDALKAFLYDKIKGKIEKETEGIDISIAKEKLYFQPVLWHIDLKKFQEYRNFFKDFSLSLGNDFGLDFNILGFCTYGTIDKTDFIFVELSTFYDKYSF